MNALTCRTRIRPAQSGFTLVEIMVVIVILGLLATLVATNVIGASDDARRTKAQTDVRTIADAIKMYRATNGKAPESLEELVTKDDRGRSYLDDLPKDPWGNDYQYVNPGTHGGEYDLFTLGADNQEGGEGTNADVGNWNTD